MKYHLTHLARVVMLLGYISICAPLIAQDKLPFAVTLKDSLFAGKSDQFIYNNIRLKDLGGSSSDYSIRITPPEGWRLLAPGRELNKHIDSAGFTVLTIVLMKQQTSPALWLPVTVSITGHNRFKQYIYYVKADPISDFSVTPLTSLVQLQGTERIITISTKIRNNGTVDGKYVTSYKNNELDVRQAIPFRLKPGMDTVITHTILLTDPQWNRLTSQRIDVTVADTTGTSYMDLVEVRKVQHELKDHPSKYNTFPLIIDGGYTNWGNQSTYYAGVRGDMTFDKSKLMFYYRTKQYGMGNNLERNVFGVDYNTRRWDLYAGHMGDYKYFYVYGTGGRVSFKPDSGVVLSVSGSLHNNIPGYTNDNATASAQYLAGKVAILSAISANHDTGYNLNSFVFANEAQVIRKSNLKLLLNAGVGQDYVLKGPGERDLGYSGGYSIQYNGPVISLYSQMQYNSDDYPGINRGLRIQSHTFTVKAGKGNVGAFYQYNRNPVTTLHDTIYNTDLLTYNYEKYGLVYNLGLNNGNFSISGGGLQQTGLGGNTLPEYIFGEIIYQQRFGQDGGIYLSSESGYNPSYGNPSKAIFLTTSILTASYRWAGIKGYYQQQPQFDRTNTKEFLDYQQTILAGPFVNLIVLKRIKANLFYNISKSLYDNSIYNLVGGMLSYNNRNNGVSVTLNATIPLENTPSLAPNGVNTKYINVILSKKFNVPIFTTQKYYTLNLLPFFDVNGNGVKDPGERLIPNLEIVINSIPFISDANGLIAYKHIDPGTYKLDFSQTKTIKGIIPATGLYQTIPVSKDITIALPFKKSSVISGVLSIKTDAINNTKVHPENMKIIATSADGVTFTTLTDMKGNYFLNVPAGKYTVSLNPDAFTDKVKPKVMSYQTDLTKNMESKIDFEIIDKSREIKFFTPNPK
ncbi:hypothetical protein [Chitinophaga sp. Cy-1792]|uniref:hypothetical protein n=1 Tax=Chitinophaga sp. Cy-1792 TaxID=2608339 RepID=UPI001421729C|nr:hypothetical protein [Chitinophaga sp. Cy-1792]NIG55972.1 hypothetical protein [Chitinophaga sp. Cy-1792]